VQVVYQPLDVVVPVVRAQRAPGEIADAVERRRQFGGWRRRSHVVAKQRNEVRTAGQGVGHFAADRVRGVVDPQGSAIVGRGEQLRREQQQEYRPCLERLRDLLAPADPGAQIILVEENLLVAKDGAEITRQGRRLVLAVGRAVADEHLRHWSALASCRSAKLADRALAGSVPFTHGA
jgi:hypothetical protein